MDRDQADTLVLDIIALVIDAVADVLPHYVGHTMTRQVLGEVRGVITQEFQALRDEEG